MIVTESHVFGLEESIEASGFPMRTDDTSVLNGVSERDIDRAEILAGAAAGSGHDCFLKGITVQGNLKYSQVLTRQIQRYHWFEFVSSTSTMHRISKMNIRENCRPEVTELSITQLEMLIDKYNQMY